MGVTSLVEVPSQSNVAAGARLCAHTAGCGKGEGGRQRQWFLQEISCRFHLTPLLKWRLFAEDVIAQ